MDQRTWTLLRRCVGGTERTGWGASAWRWTIFHSPSSAALIVWEHRWAARVAQAIRDAGGRIVAGQRVPDEIVEQALADLATG
jgi:hypothetical protein